MAGQNPAKIGFACAVHEFWPDQAARKYQSPFQRRQASAAHQASLAAQAQLRMQVGGQQQGDWNNYASFIPSLKLGEGISRQYFRYSNGPAFDTGTPKKIIPTSQNSVPGPGAVRFPYLAPGGGEPPDWYPDDDEIAWGK